MTLAWILVTLRQIESSMSVAVASRRNSILQIIQKNKKLQEIHIPETRLSIERLVTLAPFLNTSEKLFSRSKIFELRK
ncbi:hypothetical protein WN55_10816 [Dufourea novaeangliae]|uniref:Uncharacterized protein n=1 Tax=Dufourea novaeangliae TaxID=178035 RepID=A0A154PB91_DUFNO|nr:hypothetical protein WN55_10816 [Dufourea novaeangliae]